jgi:ParB family transcriptional regulator, chromosome partitioning protein
MTDRRTERRGLGRGLAALMMDVGVDPGMARSRDPAVATRGLRDLPIDVIVPNPDQPRRHFDPDLLQELAGSIREKGVLQPIVVRPAQEMDDRYEIVAGERRWRAAQMAGLHQLPAIVRTLSDSEVLELAIIENIQREDLNPVEEAVGYRSLIDRFGHSQEQIAQALGKSRSHVANVLRLLQLPESVQDHVREGRLSAGHARALITSADPERLAQEVITRSLSVRDTEALVRDAARPAAQRVSDPEAKDADTRVLEQDISANLGMSVVIDHRPDGQGRVIVRYRTLDQLDQVCRLLGGN